MNFAREPCANLSQLGRDFLMAREGSEMIFEKSKQMKYGSASEVVGLGRFHFNDTNCIFRYLRDIK